MDDERETISGEWLRAVLGEYKSLRDEAVAARDAQLAVLRFGVAIIGALVALGLAGREQEPELSGVMLCVLVPAVIFFVVELWVGEIQRSNRAGSFVATIERELARYFKDSRNGSYRPPMGWENWLRRDGSGEYKRANNVRALVVSALFLFFMGGSYLVGLGVLREKHLDSYVAACTVAAVVILASLLVRATYVIGQIRSERPPDAEAVAKSVMARPIA